jgi:cytochrome P450
VTAVSSTVLRPPGPRDVSGRSTGRRYLADPLGYLQSLQREYGDIVYFKLGLQDVYLLSDPQLIHDVLVTHDRKLARVAGPVRGYSRIIGEGTIMTSEGERYRRQRRLVAPALHHRRVMSYGSIMVEEALALAESWREGEPRDIQTDMNHVTLAIVMRALFGADMPASSLSGIAGHVEVVLEAFSRRQARYATLQGDRTQRAIAALDELVYALLAERRRDGVDRGDLLSMLLLAQDEEGDGSGMTDQEIRGEVLALIAAGHDTSSSALTWTWYLLSQNPDAERRLVDELGSVVGDRTPGAEDLPALPYLDRVVSESLRMYPPSGLGTDRLVQEEVELGGFRIPVGSIILFSQYVVQHDPRWFREPDRFDPDRWTPEARATRPKLSYFPFSGGSRACVGSGFASMEIALVIAAIAARWRLVTEPGYRPEIEARITITPRGGMPMTPERRR